MITERIKQLIEMIKEGCEITEIKDLQSRKTAQRTLGNDHQ